MPLLLLIKLFKQPPNNLDLKDYIVHVSPNTSVFTSKHLKPADSLISRWNFYKILPFEKVIKTWNALPIVELDQSYATIRKQVLSSSWKFSSMLTMLTIPCTVIKRLEKNFVFYSEMVQSYILLLFSNLYLSLWHPFVYIGKDNRGDRSIHIAYMYIYGKWRISYNDGWMFIGRLPPQTPLTNLSQRISLQPATLMAIEQITNDSIQQE